ncbi:hypothetical protein KC660_02910 [Candidatus Dojkabacteria bacterium]|uniref:7 transmembrane helices usually fused to an inactive transglutaminase domain-containing protein n=1 Tax=Candidatus Dojkabacteria bacterium TaxID=2099670 RepID=A0A955RI20_9BACT|nr:hypothetical protein [Candidatus Dojkabacteria bacterium]
MNEYLQFLIYDKNLSELIIYLVLTLPVVATIVSFARHVIGIQTLGIYSPIALTYAFFSLGIINGSVYADTVLGLKYGITLILVVFIASTIMHLITRLVRLHYIPKMAIVLTGVVVAILAIMSLSAHMDKSGFISVNVLALLLIILIAEQYINIYVNKNGKKAMKLGLMTVILAILSYLLISWDVFAKIVLNQPILVLIATIVINLIIGRLTTLRLTEIFRFWDLLTQEPSDEK